MNEFVNQDLMRQRRGLATRAATRPCPWCEEHHRLLRSRSDTVIFGVPVIALVGHEQDRLMMKAERIGESHAGAREDDLAQLGPNTPDEFSLVATGALVPCRKDLYPEPLFDHRYASVARRASMPSRVAGRQRHWRGV